MAKKYEPIVTLYSLNRKKMIFLQKLFYILTLDWDFHRCNSPRLWNLALKLRNVWRLVLHIYLCMYITVLHILKKINNHSMKISNNIVWGFTQININIHAEYTRQKLFLLKAQRKNFNDIIKICIGVTFSVKLQMLHT